MACSVASGDRVMGSCMRWQVVSVHCPQNSRQQHVSLGTPVALMGAVMFWPPAQSTWVSGIPGTLRRRVCWSLYSRSGRWLMQRVGCATFCHLYGLLFVSLLGWHLPYCCSCCCAAAGCTGAWAGTGWLTAGAGYLMGSFSAVSVCPFSILLKVTMEANR